MYPRARAVGQERWTNLRGRRILTDLNNMDMRCKCDDSNHISKRRKVQVEGEGAEDGEGIMEKKIEMKEGGVEGGMRDDGLVKTVEKDVMQTARRVHCYLRFGRFPLRALVNTSEDLDILFQQVKTNLKIDQNIKICLSIVEGGFETQIDDPIKYKTYYWERAKTEKLKFDVAVDIGAPGFEIVLNSFC